MPMLPESAHGSLAITAAMLTAWWPHAPHSLVDGIAASSEAVFAKYGLTTAAEVADFMAQISEETGGGFDTEENLHYSAPRLCQVWPSLFPSLASAAPYVGNPRLLADKVYGGRYGNQPGTDDGYNFRGRGLIQITFRDWYAKLGVATTLDLVNNPDLANAPAHALDVACAFWKSYGVNVFADRGDFRGETLRVNGGLTNYGTRLAWRTVWRKEFGLT